MSPSPSCRLHRKRRNLKHNLSPCRGSKGLPAFKAYKMREKEWLPPSGILGDIKLVNDILGPVLPGAAQIHAIETEGGVDITTEGGAPIEVEH